MTGSPLSAQDLTTAPTFIRHLLIRVGRTNADVEVSTCSHGYRIALTSPTGHRRLKVHLTRRKRTWWEQLSFFEGDTEVDVPGGLPEMLRRLGKPDDLVGSPTADTRHPGANHALQTRSHTVIRV